MERRLVRARAVCADADAVARHARSRRIGGFFMAGNWRRYLPTWRENLRMMLRSFGEVLKIFGHAGHH